MFRTAIILACLTHAAFAKDVVLWDRDGVISRQYQTLVYGIQAGDRVFVGDRHFDVSAVRGNGSTSHVFAVGGGKAIRLASSDSLLKFVRRFYDAYREELLPHGVPMLKIDLEASDPERVLVVEDLGEKIETLFDVARAHMRGEPGAAEKLEGLVEFARRVSRFREIADFNQYHLFWKDGEWRIMDWDKPSLHAAEVEDASVLWTAKEKRLFPHLPTALEMRIREATISARRRDCAGFGGI